MAKGSDSAAVDVWTSPAILIVSSTAAALLPLLPFRIPADHGAAPVTISGDLDHALFVVSILLAFTFSFSAVLLERKPRPATRVFKISAALSITSAAALLLHLIFFSRVA